MFFQVGEELKEKRMNGKDMKEAAEVSITTKKAQLCHVYFTEHIHTRHHILISEAGNVHEEFNHEEKGLRIH